MAVAFNEGKGGNGSLRQSPNQLFSTAVAAHQRGQVGEAERLYRAILAQYPEHADALHYAGVAALQQGRTEDGIALIRRSLTQRPDDVETNYHLGLAFATSGRFEETAAQNRKVIALAPGHVEAHLNLGNALKEMGRLEDAADAYRRAIAHNPNIAVIHYNLANLRVQQRNYDAAFACFDRALALQPNFVEAMLGRATALLRLNQSSEALVSVCRALDIGATVEAKALFLACLRSADLPRLVPSLDRHLVTALREPWGWPREVATAALATRKSFLDALAIPRDDDTTLTTDRLSALAADPVLGAALETVTIDTLQVEAVLTAARRTLLERALDATAPKDAALLGFACALARQCFINEYVFALSPQEERRAAGLRDRLIGTLDGGAPVDPFAIAVAAAYRPLLELPSAERLLAPSSPALEDLFTQQLREPAAERELRQTIPAITEVEDAVSLAVQQQYEENPFPRWITMPRPKQPMPLGALLRTMLPHGSFEPFDKDVCDVLVAGCGSGQEPIDIALRMQGAKVLAVDLSRASLAYGQRKAREMNVGNVEFAQGDILKLHTLGRTFDYVTASGVMHHMADPFAAWRNLLSLVRPGGIMTVALYSEAARQHVVAARDLIAQHGFAATPEGIRAARRAIVALPEGAPAKRNVLISDFFSTSDCRDLLFHVQELRLTIPQISNFIAASGARFLGFRLPAGVTERYLARFPDDPTLTDLDNWHSFEIEQPETFADMYQFIVQTAGAPASQTIRGR